MAIFPKNKAEKIVAYLLERPETVLRVNEVARTLEVNKATVSITIKRLGREGILSGKRVNISNPTVRALKVLLNVERLTKSGSISQLRAVASAAGLYGSAAKGTDTEASDIDIWITPKSNIGRLEAAGLANKLGDRLGRPVQIIAVDRQRLNAIRKDGTSFYYSLVFGSVILFGEGID